MKSSLLIMCMIFLIELIPHSFLAQLEEKDGSLANSLVINNVTDGSGAASRIGIGTTSPEQDLHIAKWKEAKILLEDNANTV